MDDLTVIKGIGPMRAADLAAHNIDTFQALATADADFLVKTMEVTPTMIAGWQAAALIRIQDAALRDGRDDFSLGAVLEASELDDDVKEVIVYEHFLTGRIKRD